MTKFRRLIALSPYAGMENSIELAGELNKAAQEIFLNFMASSFNGLKPDLWSFQLFKGNVVNLRVEDFSVSLLFLDESELEDLSSKDIDLAPHRAVARNRLKWRDVDE